MRFATFLPGLLIAASASLAAAQGVNLSLDDCGAFGATNAAADCGTNTGIAMSLVGSAVAPAGLDRVTGMDAYIDVVTNQASLSPWWTLDGCRIGALTFGFDFSAGPGSCADFWAGAALGGGGISPAHPAPNRFRISLACGVPTEAPLAAGVETYMFRANISKAKSSGAGACAGCPDAACFVLNQLVIRQPAGVGDWWLTTPVSANYVTYNGGGGIFGGCPGALPTQNRTWGQVKALYR